MLGSTSYICHSHLKTIKPADTAGIAGGEKFIVHSILFKFATREGCGNLYPNDELAMKAAGHDMRGLSAVYQSGIENLRTPLMCIVCQHAAFSLHWYHC